MSSLSEARSATAICREVARATWAKVHGGAECPENRIPTPEVLAGWLPQCAAVDATVVLIDSRGRNLRGAWTLGAPTARPANGTGKREPPDKHPLLLVLEEEPRRLRDGTRSTQPGEGWWGTIELAHKLWLKTRTVGSKPPRHPLSTLIDAWQRLAPVPAEWDAQKYPVMPGTLAGRSGGLRPLMVANDLRQLPLDLTGGTGEPPRQLWLGFEQPEPDRVPVLPLVAFDRRGGVSMTRGPGAAHAIRLYVEALLALPADLRRAGYGPPVSLHAKLRNVVAGLWPRGWQRGRDWPRLMAGFDELRKLGVEWDHDGTGGVWFAVTVRSVPRNAQLDDMVRFEVLLPPGSGPGPMVSRAHLRLLGLDSAPAYRLYLSLCWYWDHYGTVGGRLIGVDAPQRRNSKRSPVQPVKVGGRLVNPATLHHYPALSPDDLATMSYAPADIAPVDSSTRRTQRQRARKALDRVALQTGAVVLPATGTDVHVLPPAEHKAAHDSKADLWHHVKNRLT